MERVNIAQGAWLTTIPAEKFKRCKVAVHLVAPSVRGSATALALLPHVLDRRSEKIPDATALSRKLYSLYGAELTSESYTAGANRVITLGISGLKNAYALNGEDLAGEYLELLCGLLFAPKLSGGVFEAEDVAIEKEKQAEYLRSELNDKRGYCMRQARRKLYKDSPLGVESSGYLEDIDAITPKSLFAAYQTLLRGAQIEVMACGMDAQTAAARVARHLDALERRPEPLPELRPLPNPGSFEHFSEAMPTVQGKLCILCASGHAATAYEDTAARLASALYGGLPTSRLFTNVREKQSLCYYCASSFGAFGGTLSIDSGVDHSKAELAAKAILEELRGMQSAPVRANELENAKRYLNGAFSSAKDSPDALLNWAFIEQLKGTRRSIDELNAEIKTVTAEAVRQVMARFAPAVEYVITGKGGGD